MNFNYRLFKDALKSGMVLWFVVCCPAAYSHQIDVKREFALAAKQLSRMLQMHPDTTKFPFSSNPDGSPKDMPSRWWCSGFFPGSLWHMYEYTGNKYWKDAADKWTMALAKEQYNKTTHDLGFMMYCSYGNGYRLTGNAAYYAPLLNAAASLATRFDPAVGAIRSWNDFHGYKYPVIIDNMMNLELLIWATKASGNKKLTEIAVAHADKTLRNHFRADGSCYHVICYDDHGDVLAKKNHQGYKDNSSWSRGQAWALYGYTVMYRETHRKAYLAQAIKIASYILNNPTLPADKIPYWDYNAPQIPNEERDVSAAAVTASALLELQKYVPAKRSYYLGNAKTILKSLASPAYRAKAGDNNNFLLKHSVGSKTLNNEVDQPLVYADYYYLEALLRYSKLQKRQ